MSIDQANIRRVQKGQKTLSVLTHYINYSGCANTCAKKCICLKYAPHFTNWDRTLATKKWLRKQAENIKKICIQYERMKGCAHKKAATLDNYANGYNRRSQRPRWNDENTRWRVAIKRLGQESCCSILLRSIRWFDPVFLFLDPGILTFFNHNTTCSLCAHVFHHGCEYVLLSNCHRPLPQWGKSKKVWHCGITVS